MLRCLGAAVRQPAALLLAALLSISFLAWLGYAGAVLAHKLVFYGRILHFFGPFIVLGALVALHKLAGARLAVNTLLLIFGSALALGHFGAFASAYKAVEYPSDVAYDHGIHDYNQIAANEISVCDKNVIFNRLFGPRLRPIQVIVSQPIRYQFINFAYLYPISCYKAPGLKAGTVVASAPYFMKYPAYQFEGHNQAQRAILRNYAVEFRIVKMN